MKFKRMKIIENSWCRSEKLKGGNCSLICMKCYRSHPRLKWVMIVRGDPRLNTESFYCHDILCFCITVPRLAANNKASREQCTYYRQLVVLHIDILAYWRIDILAVLHIGAMFLLSPNAICSNLFIKGCTSFRGRVEPNP